MPNSASRRASSFVTLMLVVSIGCGAQIPVFADAIALSASRGPGTGEVTLQWSGGTGPYRVFRGSNAPSVLDPGNLRVTTAGTSHVDAPPPGTMAFYTVVGEGPPEIQAVTPAGARFGDNIVVYGQNFGTDAAVVRVRFSFTEPSSLESLTVDQPVFAAVGTRLDLAVPMATPERINRVTVLVNGVPSNTVDYFVGALPPDPTPGVAGNEVAAFIDETDALMVLFDGKLDPWFVQTGALPPEDVAAFHQDVSEIRAALGQMRAGVLANAPGDLAAMDAILGSPSFQDLLTRIRDAKAALHGSPLGSIMCEGRSVRDVVRDIIDVINIIDDILDTVQAAMNAACAASTIFAIFTAGLGSPLAAVICSAAALVNTIIAPIMDSIVAVSSAVDAIASAAPVDPVPGTLTAAVSHALWSGTEPTYVYVQGSVPNEAVLSQDFHNGDCGSGCAVTFDITIYGIDIPISIDVPHVVVEDLRMTCAVSVPAPAGFTDLGTVGDSDVCRFTGADAGSGWVRGSYTIGFVSSCGDDTLGPVNRTYTLVSGPRITSASPATAQLQAPIDVHGDYMPPAVTANLAQAKADFGDIGARMTFSENGHYRFRVPDTANPNGGFGLVVQGRPSEGTLPFAILPPVLTALRISPAFEGEEVELHGTGFAQDMAENHVTIDGLAASFVRPDAFGLVFRVPVGATSGPVKVTAVTHESNTLPLDVRRWGPAPGIALSHTGRDAANPSLAVHADGTAGVLWVDRDGPGDGSRLLFTDAAPADGGFRAPVVVAPSGAGTALAGRPSAPQAPDVALGPDHRFHAVWINVAGEVLVSSFAKGAAAGAPVVAISPLAGRAMRDPAIAVMADGSVHVAATEVPLDGDIHARLLHARSTDGGATFGGPSAFMAPGIGSVSDDLHLGEVDLAFANGRLWRAFTQFRIAESLEYGESPQREVFTQWSSDGVTWSSAEPAGAGRVDVPHSGAGSSTRSAPSVSGDAAGGAVAAWDAALTTPYVPDGPTEIFASRAVALNAEPYAAAGVGRVTPPSAGAQTDVGHASLVHHLPGGNPMTAVASVRRIPGMSPDNLAGVPRVHVRRFPLRDTTTTTLFETTPTVLPGDTTTQDASPSLAADDAEHYHLAWLSGPEGNRVVRYQTTRVHGWPSTVPDDPPGTPAVTREVLAVNMGNGNLGAGSSYHWGVLLVGTSHPEETAWAGVSPLPNGTGQAGRPALTADGRVLFHGHGNLYGATLASPDGHARVAGLDVPSAGIHMSTLEEPTVGADGRLYGMIPAEAYPGSGYFWRALVRSDVTGTNFARVGSFDMWNSSAHYAVSPSGAYIAWRDSDYMLHVYEVATGIERLPLMPESNSSDQFDFAAAADRIVSTDRQPCSYDPERGCYGLAIWDLPTDTRQVLAETETMEQPQLNADGTVAVYRCFGPGCCDDTTGWPEYALCTTNGHMVPRTPGMSDGSPVFSPDGTRIAFLRHDTANEWIGQVMVWTIGAPAAVPLTGPVLGTKESFSVYDLSWRTITP